MRQYFKHLGDVGGDAPSLVAGEAHFTVLRKEKPRARRRCGGSRNRLMNLLHEPVDRRLVDRI